MLITGRVLKTDSINCNGQFVDKKSLKKAILDYIKRYVSVCGSMGLLYFYDEKEECAARITSIRIDHDGYLAIDGKTVPSSSGKRLENSIINGDHLSIGINGIFNDCNETAFVERIQSFIIKEREDDTNKEWEIEEKCEDMDVPIEDYYLNYWSDFKFKGMCEVEEDNCKVDNCEEVCEERDAEVCDEEVCEERDAEVCDEEECEKEERYIYSCLNYLTAKDINNILKIADDILNVSTKKECLNMTKEEYLNKILESFKMLKE